MTSIDPDWQNRAARSPSYRRMFLLAQELSQRLAAPRNIRRMAKRVANLLGPVIDQPIAPASRLAAARQHFDALCKAVASHMRG